MASCAAWAQWAKIGLKYEKWDEITYPRKDPWHRVDSVLRSNVGEVDDLGAELGELAAKELVRQENLSQRKTFLL